jgi:hypothetical protein
MFTMLFHYYHMLLLLLLLLLFVFIIIYIRNAIMYFIIIIIIYFIIIIKLNIINWITTCWIILIWKSIQNLFIMTLIHIIIIIVIIIIIPRVNKNIIIIIIVIFTHFGRFIFSNNRTIYRLLIIKLNLIQLSTRTYIVFLIYIALNIIILIINNRRRSISLFNFIYLTCR